MVAFFLGVVLKNSAKKLLGQFFGFKVSSTNEIVDIVKIALPAGLGVAQFRKEQELYADNLGVSIMAGLVWETKDNGGVNYSFESYDSSQEKHGHTPTIFPLEQELIDCIDP